MNADQSGSKGKSAWSGNHRALKSDHHAAYAQARVGKLKIGLSVVVEVCLNDRTGAVSGWRHAVENGLLVSAVAISQYRENGSAQVVASIADRPEVELAVAIQVGYAERVIVFKFCGGRRHKHRVLESAARVAIHDADAGIAASQRRTQPDQVQDAVAVHVHCGGHVKVGEVVSVEGKRSIAISEHDGDFVGFRFRSRQIELPIPVEVANRHYIRADASSLRGDVGLESSVAIAQKHIDHVISACRQGEIQFAIAIEVGSHQVIRTDASQEVFSRLEGAVAVAQKYRDVVGVVDRGQIEFAVTIEIGRNHGAGVRKKGRVNRRLESAIAVAQGNIEIPAIADGTGDVQFAVTIEVGHNLRLQHSLITVFCFGRS